jgi:hypothetical protein
VDDDDSNSNYGESQMSAASVASSSTFSPPPSTPPSKSQHRKNKKGPGEDSSFFPEVSVRQDESMQTNNLQNTHAIWPDLFFSMVWHESVQKIGSEKFLKAFLGSSPSGELILHILFDNNQLWAVQLQLQSPLPRVPRAVNEQTSTSDVIAQHHASTNVVSKAAVAFVLEDCVDGAPLRTFYPNCFLGEPCPPELVALNESLLLRKDGTLDVYCGAAHVCKSAFDVARSLSLLNPVAKAKAIQEAQAPSSPFGKSGGGASKGGSSRNEAPRNWDASCGDALPLSPISSSHSNKAGGSGRGKATEMKMECSSSGQDRGGFVSRVERLRTSCDDRVFLDFAETASFSVSCHCRLNLRAQSNLLESVFMVVDLTLPVEVAVALKSDYATWLKHHDKIASVKPAPFLQFGVLSDDMEWETFLLVILTLLACPKSNGLPRDRSTTATTTTKSPWELMMSTDFHQSFSKSNRALLSVVSDSTFWGFAQVQQLDGDGTVSGSSTLAYIQSVVRHFPELRTNESRLMAHLPHLFFGLHLLFEDSHLSRLTTPSLKPLAKLLYTISKSWCCPQCRASKDLFAVYADYYQREFGSIDSFLPDGHIKMGNESRRSLIATLPAEVPDIRRWIFSVFAGARNVEVAHIPFPDLLALCSKWSTAVPARGSDDTKMDRAESPPPTSAFSVPAGHCRVIDRHDIKMRWLNPCKMTKRVATCLLRLYDTTATTTMGVAVGDTNYVGNAFLAAERCMLGMLEEGMSLEQLTNLPFGISQPFREALRVCRHCPRNDWAPAAFCLIGREDLLSNSTAYKASRFSGGSAYLSVSAMVQESASQKTRDGTASTEPVNDCDGLKLVEKLSTLRFSKDRRMKEVCRLLRSSRPLFLKVRSLQPSPNFLPIIVLHFGTID